ncbi:MAG: NifU family protein [Myxococcota bacterium]
MQPTPSTAAPAVRAVDTPNPDARMFRVNETLIPTGTHEFTDPTEAAERSPLAERLLQIDGVELVLVAPRFVTVRKATEADWAWLSPTVSASLGAFLRSGEMAVFEGVGVGLAGKERSEIERKIIEILDEDIRPAIAQDGGDVVFEGFQNGVVYLRLIGACGTCPSSTATLKHGIERYLREEIPEVTGVEQR